MVLTLAENPGLPDAQTILQIGPFSSVLREKHHGTRETRFTAVDPNVMKATTGTTNVSLSHECIQLDESKILLRTQSGVHQDSNVRADARRVGVHRQNPGVCHQIYRPTETLLIRTHT